MGMGMKMNYAVVVAMAVKMNPLLGQAVEQMAAEADQHQPDTDFQPRGEVSADRQIEHDRRAGERHQGQGMAKPPNRPMANDAADRGLARGQAADGGQVVGLERVLHPDQETQKQHRQHGGFLL